jgi:hypothetical protein
MRNNVRVTEVVLLGCLAIMPVQAAEYCLRPDKEDGTQTNSVVCCTTPFGWQGWKDDPHYWDGIKGFNKQLLESEHRMRVSFDQPNCKRAAECATLMVEAWGRGSRGQPDIEQGMRDLLRQIRQHQDVRGDPDPVVTEPGSFETGNAGRLTIWEIRCSFWKDYLVTQIAQRDVLVTIYLEAPDIQDIRGKVDSLKELAQSVRITAANVSLPEIIKIDVSLSDENIKEQLFQLTPPGTKMEKVYEYLQSHLYKDSLVHGNLEEVHRGNGYLYTQIGGYSNTAPTFETPVPKSPTTDQELRLQPSVPKILPSTTVVRAVWKFDQEHKLLDIEIKREVVEFKPK